MNRWIGPLIIAGTIVTALHFTGPAPSDQSPPPAEPDANVPESPAVLGFGRYPAGPSVPPHVLTVAELLADQEAIAAERLDLGGFTYQTEPTTWN